MMATPHDGDPDDDLVTRHVDQQEIDALIAGLAAREPNAPLAEGAWQVGPYRLTRELGRGSMGTVFLALHVALQREVALKVLPVAAAYAPDARERFLREAKALARVEHPAVVRIHDVIEAHGTLAIAMERIDGPTLADVLGRLARSTPTGSHPTPSMLAAALGVDASVLPPGGYARWVTAIGIELAEALQAVHDAGLTHRDVKPSNVLLDRRGHAHLADFGVVRDIDSSLTGSGGFVGTAPYAAPEQLRGETIVDARVDVYGLGATLYEMFSLVPPFRGSPATILDAAQRGAVKPLGRRKPGAPDDLALIVHSALAPEAARRYASAESLAEDLRAYRDGRPLSVRPSTRLERLALWARREPARARLAGIAGAALVALVLVGGLALSQLPRIAAAIEVERDREFDELVERAYLASSQNHLRADAIDLFGQALRLRPESPLAIGGLALAHAANGRVARARSLLTDHSELLATTPGLRFLADAGVELLTSPPQVDHRVLEESTDGMECFFAAMSARARAQSLISGARRQALMQDVEALLDRALALVIPAPRVFRSELAAAAATAEHGARARLLIQGLRTRWPDSPSIAFRSAAVLRNAGAPADALSVTESAAFAAFDPQVGTLLRVQILTALGRTDDALAAIETIPESAPEFEQAMYEKAELLNGGTIVTDPNTLATSLTPAARECVERALLRARRRLDELARQGRDRRNLVSGITTLLIYLGRLDEREGVLVDALRDAPEDWRSHAELAQTIAISTRPQRTRLRALLGQRAKVGPQDGQPDPDELRGEIDARLALAREHALIAVEGAPYHLGVLHMVRITLMVDIEDCDAAIPLYQTQLDIDPEDFEMTDQLSLAAYQSGRYPEATEALRRARALRPDAPEPLALLGLCLVELGQCDAAIDALTEFEQVPHGDAKPLTQARLRMGLAWALVRRTDRRPEDIARAEAAANAVPRAAPTGNLTLALIKAEVEQAAGRTDEAIAWVEHAERLARRSNPTSSRYARERMQRVQSAQIERTRERLR